MDMSDNLKVSVVVPCYNQGHYLKEVLESIERSTYTNIEVIVVDDGSPDEVTLQQIDLLREYKVKGSQVRFFRKHNEGPAAARNFGIGKTTGDLILLLDADDKIDATYIEKCVWVLAKYPDISIVYPSVQHFGAREDVWNARPYDFNVLLYDNFIVVSAMFRRKLWGDIDGFDVKLPGYEDWDFWIRAGAAGYKGYWLPEYLFFYRKAEASRLLTDNARRKQLIKIIRKKNKHVYKVSKAELKKNTTRKDQNEKQNSGWVDYLKWKAFVFYVRLASKVPESIKERGRRLVKPIIRNIFKYPETGYGQEASAESLPMIKEEPPVNKGYIYRKNQNYIECFFADKKIENVKDGQLSILFIVPWLVVGGADKVNLDLIQEFRKKEHDVHLFSTLNDTHPWHEKFKAIIPSITHLGNWFKEEDELLDYVIDYIYAKSIDVVQMSNSQLGYQISGIIKRYCPHVKLVDLNHMEEPYYPFDYFRYSVQFRNEFDHRIVITPYLKEAMLRKYGETAKRVTVIPNGILVPKTYEETQYLVKSRNDKVVIGFVGRMEEQKQPFDFIRAAELVLQECDNVEFMLIGDGSLLAPSKKLASSLNIEEKLSFLGSRNDAVELMRKHMLLLLAPSLREGLPIVGLEAFSLGIPIISTKVPGWTDLVYHDQTGYVASMGNYEAMADFCIKLIKNAELRNQISKNAYYLARDHYSIEKTSSMYLTIYESLIKGEEDERVYEQ